MTSQEQELLTRVARAICVAEGYDPDYEGDYGPNWNGYTGHARAAIEACANALECASSPPPTPIEEKKP